jgi:predicted permease
MRTWLAWCRRLGTALGVRRRAVDLPREIESHLQLHIEDNLRAGMSPVEARREAILAFGEIETVKQDHWDGQTAPFVETVARDVRYAVRTLRRSPGFTLVAVLTLALGIGANTAVFAIIDAVLLRPLPFADPDRVVSIRGNQSLPNLDDIRARARSFQAVGGVVTPAVNLTGSGDPVQVIAGWCNADLFLAVGMSAAAGRVIAVDDDRPGAAPVVVLSDEFWHRQFAGTDILGRTLDLGGKPYTVIGVLRPRAWPSFRQPDVWLSLRVASPEAAPVRNLHFLETYLRLRPGVTIAQAQSEMNELDRVLEQQYPMENRGRHRVLMSPLERLAGSSRSSLLLLGGAASLVLLIAAANFGGLLLARSTSRRREIAIRASLGATRTQLVRHLFAEAMLISLVGGAAGVAIATECLLALPALSPPNLPRLADANVSSPVLLFAFAASVLTGLVFGLAPALRASRVTLVENLAPGGRSASAHATGLRTRRTLVVVQTALAIVLLVGAGLLVKSFWQLQTVDPGFRAPWPATVTMRIELPAAQYGDLLKQRLLRRELLDGLNSQTGVRAALVSELPMSGESQAQQFLIEGQPTPPAGDEPEVQSRTVDGDYFTLLSIPVPRGRSFAGSDRDGSPPVVLVNDSFVRRFLPDRSPRGVRVRWARESPPAWMTIVGVVGDVRHFGPTRGDEPAIYDLYSQTTAFWKRWMYLVVSADRPGLDPTSIVRATLARVDAGLPLTRVRRLADVVASAANAQRFLMLLLAVFAALALSLGGIGLYGLMAYAVTQRLPEMSVRMALGASRRAILRQVLWEGAKLTLIGGACGIVAAVLIGPLIAGLLFAVTVYDRTVLVTVALVMAGVTMLASYAPARRATRAEIVDALRGS